MSNNNNMQYIYKTSMPRHSEADKFVSQELVYIGINSPLSVKPGDYTCVIRCIRDQFNNLWIFSVKSSSVTI